MRTIAINPTKRRRNVAKKRTPAKTNKANPVRRRRRRKNQATGLTTARMEELAFAGAGGAAAGILTGFMETNKPAFLAMVPTEAIGVIAGVSLAWFAKGPAAKAAASGMVAYGAGQLAARYATGFGAAAGNGNGNGNGNGQVSALMYANNPAHIPSHHKSAVHVGGLTYTVED